MVVLFGQPLLKFDAKSIILQRGRGSTNCRNHEGRQTSSSAEFQAVTIISYSARADLGPLTRVKQLCATYPPFSGRFPHRRQMAPNPLQPGDIAVS